MDKDKDSIFNWIIDKLDNGLSPNMVKEILKKNNYDPKLVDIYLNLLNKQEYESKEIVEKEKIIEKTRNEGKSLEELVTKTKIEVKDKIKMGKWIKTGIDGLDKLFKKGIPRSSIMLVLGGPGSGKTIFCLQSMYYAVQNGEKVLYMSYEEEPEKLREHMLDFGWNPEKYEKENLLRIKKYDSLKSAKVVEALMERAEGELKIEVPNLFLEDNFIPDRVFVDSLSAVAASFVEKTEYYRLYLQEFFNQFRKTGITPFLITESQEYPERLTKTGVEEFLADGIIILHTFTKRSHKERGVEIYKLRGAEFEEKIVAMQILTDKGIVVYPSQELLVSMNK